MAPEQALGEKVDARADVFSLGVVLHEMITGRRPFAGSSAPAVLTSVLRDTPEPVNAVRPGDPGRLARHLEHNVLGDRFTEATRVLEPVHHLKLADPDILIRYVGEALESAGAS